MACIYQSTRLTPISEGFSQVLFLWKMPCSQVLTFSTLWKTLWKFTGFSQGLSQVFSQGKNSQGFSQGFAWVLTLWKMPCSQVLTFSTMWKTLKVHRFLRSFSQGLSQVFSEGKNSQGFAWVLSLWKMPCSQGLNSFTPCEKGVKNMWNWTVYRLFTAFSHVFIQYWKVDGHMQICSALYPALKIDFIVARIPFEYPLFGAVGYIKHFIK